jgi:hypothetical protein
VPLLGSPELCWPLGGPPFHTYYAVGHGCLLPTEVHSALLEHEELTDVEPSSSGTALPSGVALRNENILYLLHALGLPGYFD